MGVTSCATLPFLPGTHVFSTVFKLLQANSTLFKHLWLVTLPEDKKFVRVLRDGKIIPDKLGSSSGMVYAAFGNWRTDMLRESIHVLLKVCTHFAEVVHAADQGSKLR